MQSIWCCEYCSSRPIVSRTRARSVWVSIVRADVRRVPCSSFPVQLRESGIRDPHGLSSGFSPRLLQINESTSQNSSRTVSERRVRQRIARHDRDPGWRIAQFNVSLSDSVFSHSRRRMTLNRADWLIDCLRD